MTATYTVSQVAERYLVDADKVLGWIRAGELAALNVVQRVGGRPRWRITAEALAAFEASRAAQPRLKIVRRSLPAPKRQWV